MKIAGNRDDALAYLKAVKAAFQYNRKKYDQLLKLLLDFRDGKIDIRGVKARVKGLFKGHTDLIFGFNTFLPKEHQITLPLGFKVATAFLQAVEAAFQHNRIKYDQFFKVMRDFKDQRIDTRGAVTRVKELLKGHSDLILRFNTFLPKEHQITLPFQLETTGKKLKVEENCELPWDVLDIISKTLDFDDLFQFVGVCNNWRTFHKIYWRNFLASLMASQEPLILQYHGNGSFSFISIPDQKTYNMKGMECFSHYTYVTSSSGYFIIANNNSFMLINPFTRIKKVINTPTSEVNSFHLTDRALLAFGKCSEEFVLVVLCQHRLHVYRSRNCGWVTYSTMADTGRVVDFVVLHNIIYVVTDKANIGVLSLNSANIKFLKLKSTPDVRFYFYPRLVSCVEQLLVVDLMGGVIRNVYKIDFSTMNYVKLETLGDIALFYVSNVLRRNCYALSNPNLWGYESNYMYAIGVLSTTCSVYSGDDKKLQKCITLPAPRETSSVMFDWCFRPIQYEVDYSLVE